GTFNDDGVGSGRHRVVLSCLNYVPAQGAVGASWNQAGAIVERAVEIRIAYVPRTGTVADDGVDGGDDLAGDDHKHVGNGRQTTGVAVVVQVVREGATPAGTPRLLYHGVAFVAAARDGREDGGQIVVERVLADGAAGWVVVDAAADQTGVRERVVGVD